MIVKKTNLDDVLILEPKVFGDGRGYFFESYNHHNFIKSVQDISFVQDNESCSRRGVLRGLHYQLPPYAQAKLVRVIRGSVLDVAVDIRKDSPTFGKHVTIELNSEDKRQIFVPHGFAHGFLVLEDDSIFSYKVDNYYAPDYERGIFYKDPKLDIQWPDIERILLSEKDKNLPYMHDAELF
jgi:dTDP-4-dehydrorhamnose 3,5-epimerase